MSKYLDQLNLKNTLVDADQFVIIDSQDSNNNKRVTKAVMATVFGGGGGGGSSELITNALVYTGSDIELNIADWKDIQSMNLQAGKYLILAMAGCKRTVTTAQVWQLRIQNATSNTTLSSANDNTPSNTTQFSQLNCWAIVELTAENTTIKTQARATTTSASYITKDTQTPVGNATQLIAIKLDGISGGSSYSLPIANETTLGGVKTDLNNKGIFVSGTGVIGLVDDVFGDIEIVYDNNERLSFKLNGECVNEVNLALSDNEYKNSDTTRHGLMPKLNGEDNNVLNGVGDWTKGLIYKGQLFNKDINESLYARDGYFHVAGDCTNIPVPGKDHILLSMWLADGAYQYAYVLDANVRKVYIRYYDDLGSNFYPWTEIGSGGSLPTDNWLLGNVDLYNANSLRNVINGNDIDFGSELLNNTINGATITDNLNGSYIQNSKISGETLALEDIKNSSISGNNLSIANVDDVDITGEDHVIGRHLDGVKVKNIKIAGIGVKNPYHSHAEYLACGNNNTANYSTFQNTKLTAKQRYVIQDGTSQSGVESFFLNVSGLLDPYIILIDPSVQFVTMDMHLTFQLSHLDKETKYIDSLTTGKYILAYDMYNNLYSFRIVDRAIATNDINLQDIDFIDRIRPTLFQSNQGYLELNVHITPVNLISNYGINSTGYNLDVFATIEMHTVDNGENYGLSR